MIEEGKLVEIKGVNTGLVERGRALASAIHDQVSCEEAIRHGLEIDRRLRWWVDFISPIVSSAYKTWKIATTRREEIAKPLQEAKDFISTKAGMWQRAEEEKRKAETLKLAAELNKGMEEEQMALAVSLEASGDREGAEAILNTEYKAAVVQPKTVVEGASFRTRWDFEVVNEAQVPRMYLAVDSMAIRKVVNALKDKTNIPGIKVFPETKAILRGECDA